MPLKSVHFENVSSKFCYVKTSVLFLFSDDGRGGKEIHTSLGYGMPDFFCKFFLPEER